MKQACSDQLTDELVTATEKTTTNQLERSAQLRTRATQTAASIEPNHMTDSFHRFPFQLLLPLPHPWLRQAITNLFQLLSSRELCYSLISAALLLCRAVLFNHFARAKHSTNVCVAPGTLCNHPIVYPTICNEPDG